VTISQLKKKQKQKLAIAEAKLNFYALQATVAYTYLESEKN
jgi:hypothetical protein